MEPYELQDDSDYLWLNEYHCRYLAERNYWQTHRRASIPSDPNDQILYCVYRIGVGELIYWKYDGLAYLKSEQSIIFDM